MKVSKNKIRFGILLSILTFSLFIGHTSANEYENYYGISMTSAQYNNLINQGFSENEIYYMNEETFESNKDIEATLVAETEKYYKTLYTDLNGNSYTLEITQNEYENQGLMNQRGTVTTEYKRMVSTISRLTDTFRYKVTMGWLNFPSTRSYDIIGIGFEDDVYISSSLYFSYTYCIHTGDCSTSTLYYDRKSTPYGGTVVHKLPSQSIVSLTSVLYYDVAKNNPNGTINSLKMCGDYAHATSTVNSTQYTDHGISIIGIDLGVGVGRYDEIPCAITTWSGTW